MEQRLRSFQIMTKNLLLCIRFFSYRQKICTRLPCWSKYQEVCCRQKYRAPHGLRDWEVYILMQAESGVFGTSAHEQYLLYLDYYNQQYAKEHGSYEAQITTLEEAKEEFARIQTDAKERFDNAKPRIAPND